MKDIKKAIRIIFMCSLALGITLPLAAKKEKMKAYLFVYFPGNDRSTLRDSN